MSDKDVYLKSKTRLHFFYGWWIVGACFLIHLFNTGVVMSGFTAFFEPIVNEFGWSYVQVSLAASLRGMEMCIIAPVAGLAVDHFGPRKLVFTGALILGTGMAFLSQVSNLAMFYGAFIMITIGIGASVGVVTMTAVTNWFRRKASIAIGIALSGSAVGGLLVPLITILIDKFGWRMTVLALGLGLCVLNIALSLLLRHKPEQYGYLPDGIVKDSQGVDLMTDKEQIQNLEPKIGARQVLSGRTFWHITLSYLMSFMAIMSVTTHIMPYLSSINIARSTSSFLASAVPVTSIFGRLGFGWLGSRFNSKRLAVIALSAIWSGLVFFGSIAIGDIWLSVPFIILFSIGWGGSAIMLAVLIKTYFPGGSFGTIFGLGMFVTSVGQVIGPTLTGWIFDAWGSYQSAWSGLAVLVFIASLLMLTTPQAIFSAKTADIQKAR